MSDANITVVGNVASDVHAYPAKKQGEWVASFRLASQRRYYDRRSGRWVEEPPSFYRVVCWRMLADNVRKCLKKGEPVIVQGRMKLNDWTDDDGNQRTDVEIDAWSVSYDLMRGTAVFSRTRRQVEVANEDDMLDHIRTEQRARAGDEVIVDPDTGEMFNASQLRRDRAAGERDAGRRDVAGREAGERDEGRRDAAGRGADERDAGGREADGRDAAKRAQPLGSPAATGSAATSEPSSSDAADTLRARQGQPEGKVQASRRAA